MVFVGMLARIMVLFILVLVNIVLSGFGVLGSGTIDIVASIILVLIAPYIVIGSFFHRFGDRSLGGLLLDFLLNVLVRVKFVVLDLILESGSGGGRIILRCSTVFSGYNFVTLPLRRTLLNGRNIFLNSSFVTVFGTFI